MIRAIFTGIYDRRLWGKGSGPGSNPVHCLPYINWLQTFVHANPGAKFLDVGCGDWRLGRSVDWSCVDYTGVDVVDQLVRANSNRFERPNVRFLAGDVREMNTNGFDVAIVKDVLQHLSFATIAEIFKVLAPIPIWLITNGVPLDGINRDCHDGGYRPLLMDAPPFNLRGNTALYFGQVDRHEKGKAVFVRHR